MNEYTITFEVSEIHEIVRNKLQVDTRKGYEMSNKEKLYHVVNVVAIPFSILSRNSIS